VRRAALGFSAPGPDRKGETRQDVAAIEDVTAAEQD
jgi:hypothetical protein